MKGRKNDEENGKVYTPEKIGMGGGSGQGVGKVGFFLRFPPREWVEVAFSLMEKAGRQAPPNTGRATGCFWAALCDCKKNQKKKKH